MKVKICGITNPEDALFCEEQGADVLGFIFSDKSKRYIAPEDAAVIISRLSPSTLKAGVFVNESAENINTIAAMTGINLVQLSGDEQPEIRAEIHLPVLKAFRVNSGFDFGALEEWQTDSFLFDAYVPGAYGGTGTMFNHALIPEKYYRKSIIAGGLNTENTRELLLRPVIPAGIDLSSGLEMMPGKKDPGKVKEFFTMIKETVNK